MVLEQLPAITGNNVLFFIVLVLMFVLAYKILRTVINTAIVSVLSGIFLVVLTYFGIGPPLTINNFILFMIMGGFLFIAYSSVNAFLKTSSSALSVVAKIWRWLTKPFRKMWKNRSAKRNSSKEREIVLGEMDGD